MNKTILFTALLFGSIVATQAHAGVEMIKSALALPEVIELESQMNKEGSRLVSITDVREGSEMSPANEGREFVLTYASRSISVKFEKVLVITTPHETRVQRKVSGWGGF